MKFKKFRNIFNTAFLTVFAAATISAQHVAFRNVNVVPMDKEQVLFNRTVIINNGIITAIGPSDKLNIPSGTLKVDAKGKYLMPGLADMHYHLGMIDSIHSETALLLFAYYGVTTVRNVDYIPYMGRGFSKLTPDRIIQLREQLKRKEIIGPQLFTSGCWYTDGAMSLGVKDVPDIYGRLNRYKEKGFDFLKLHDEYGQVVDSVLEIAKQLNLEVMGHIVLGYNVEKALKTYRSIEHFTSVIYPLVDFDGVLHTQDTNGVFNEIVELCRKNKTWHCATNILFTKEIAFPAMENTYRPEFRFVQDSALYRWRERIRNKEKRPEDETELTNNATHIRFRRKLCKALQEADVPMMSGTDGPLAFLIPGAAVHRELETFVQAGLSPYEALLTSTRNVATYLNTQDQEGSVAVGKKANLVLLNSNPLKNIKNTTDIAGVMVKGQWLSRADFDKLLSARDTKIIGD